MSNTILSPIQQEILKALEALGEKSKYSETILAKKIRQNAKIDTKKKAIIAISDLEKVLTYLEDYKNIFYSLSMNSANDLLIEKSENSRPLNSESRSRRVKSERAMTIFTNKDIK